MSFMAMSLRADVDPGAEVRRNSAGRVLEREGLILGPLGYAHPGLSVNFFSSDDARSLEWNEVGIECRRRGACTP
jgi:hypothetical protein